jgi:hypothetical protein
VVRLFCAPYGWPSPDLRFPEAPFEGEFDDPVFPLLRDLEGAFIPGDSDEPMVLEEEPRVQTPVGVAHPRLRGGAGQSEGPGGVECFLKPLGLESLVWSV